jgi:hypothetical protein
MQPLETTRRLFAILPLAALLVATATLTAQTLPATPPTAMQAPLAATPVSGMGSPTRPHRAEVTYTNGMLNVRANDSSLNQILRAISRETGMKITGGVQDQRVFGNYGPAASAAVLATLLDGTGTNILLTEGNGTTAPELELTPRGGGPSPPSPSASASDDLVDATPPPVTVQTQTQVSPQGVTTTTTTVTTTTKPGQTVPPVTTAQPSAPVQQAPVQQSTQPAVQPGVQPPVSGPQSIPQPLNNVNGSEYNVTPTASQIPTVHSVPTDSLPTPSTTPSSTGIVDTPNPPAPGSTTGTAPNQTATPEQIYQQLLQLQKQQSQPTSPPPQ